MDRSAKHPVRTLETSLEILETLKANDGGHIHELTEVLDVGNSAIHNHLSTLREYGYVVKREDEYHLSLKFLELGGFAQTQDDLYRAANPVVTKTAHEIGHHVDVVVEEHEQGTYLTRMSSPDSNEFETHVGHRFELHERPAGKAILAELSDERVEEIFDSRGLAPDARDSVRADLETIREVGYVHETLPNRDRRGVAVPIETDDGRVLGSLAVRASLSRRTESWFESELVDLVFEKAAAIETNLRSMFLRDAWIQSSTVRD